MTMDALELEQELPRRERRKLVTPTAAVAAAVTIAALGFAGGVQVQKSGGAEAAPAGRGAAFPGAGTRQQQQTDATVGEVASVDGDTLYVDDQNGNTIRIKVGKGGKVTRTAVEDARAIHPGDTVIVEGETRDSGTLVASSIRATASNAAEAPIGGFAAPPGGG